MAQSNVATYALNMRSRTDKEFTKNFGKQLAKLRKAKRMSQEKLASEAGMHAVAITYIETGKRRPGLTSIYKLAKALGVQPQDLFKDL